MLRLLPARVSKYAIFTVKGVQYSAPSQLIGHRVMVRLNRTPPPSSATAACEGRRRLPP